VLFGPETHPQQPDIFQMGIKPRELEIEIPRICFQQGIEDGIMQRLAQFSPSTAETKEEPPAQLISLAELEPQSDNVQVYIFPHIYLYITC
jgi:hypothetical protein